MLKLVVLFLLVVTVQSTPLQKRTSVNNPPAIINLEEPCVRQGGLCQRMEDCDPNNVAGALSPYLCPTQSHLGVVCCYL